MLLLLQAAATVLLLLPLLLRSPLLLGAPAVALHWAGSSGLEGAGLWVAEVHLARQAADPPQPLQPSPPLLLLLLLVAMLWLPLLPVSIHAAAQLPHYCFLGPLLNLKTQLSQQGRASCAGCYCC
jgi:hypothetical protein